MAHGLEVYDSNGYRMISSSSRLIRRVANFNSGFINANTTANFPITGMVNDDTWTIFVAGKGQGTWSYSVVKYSGGFNLTYNSDVTGGGPLLGFTNFDIIVART